MQTVWQHASPERLHQERSKLSRLYTFLKRYLKKVFYPSADSALALGLFSSDGILLDVFAKENDTLNRLAEDGIQAGSLWGDLGCNAVTDGLRQKESLISIGTENKFPSLQPYALYFSYIDMLSIYEPYEPTEQLGVAVIVPKEAAWKGYEVVIRGLAHDMAITIQFNNIATMYYERGGRACLSIDNRMSETCECLATYYNPGLFHLLGAEPIDMYYKPVEMLIDPLPANQELWDIVIQHKTVTNYPLTIQCHGKKVDCVASTDAFNQPSINAHGVTFFLTTQQRMTAELSKRMANGAIKTFDDIVGHDPNLQQIIHLAERMAMTDSNVMILGESGTGKDVFAQAIHNAGRRRDRPFIALNCGALPRDLIESELFGYESGAFTGARKSGNIGKFELASGGTIFLDEIGEMPLELQAKLLRVVEQKQLMRLGGSRTIDVDVKIIAATNANIMEMIAQKQFRADLFYRLSTMKLNLPPLRERKGDIVPLAEHFIRQITRKIGKPNVMRLSPGAIELLTEMNWPGNVRELQNLIECIVQLYPGDIILPQYILENSTEVHDTLLSDTVTSAAAPRATEAPRPPLTREDLLSALAQCGNNRTQAAKYLGISRRTMYRRLEEFGISNC